MSDSSVLRQPLMDAVIATIEETLGKPETPIEASTSLIRYWTCDTRSQHRTAPRRPAIVQWSTAREYLSVSTAGKSMR